ncbi:MAG: FxSxx-COOH system tetratricopeptide repeat protein [Chloroflexota bacterium]
MRDLLASFYLFDAPRFNEWLAVAREKLRIEVIAAHRELCLLYTERQAWSDGIKIARHWIAIDDLDEEAYRWLMQLLAANGQVSAALKQYKRCRQRLEQELGIEPDSVTMALAEQLSQQVPRESFVVEAIAEAEVLSLPGALPAHSYLPFHRNAIFTGRSADLMKLAEMLLPTANADGLTKAVVITGMGGLGKTQLAVEYAYRYGRYYSGGVYWLNFAKAESIDEEIAAIGGERRLGLFSETDRLPLAKKLDLIKQAWQEPTPRLLIFDNCEAVDLAATWLPISGGCSVILTSRLNRWPKAMPITHIPLLTLPREASIPFLQQLADHLTAEEADRIAHEVGDLPLALHLAGSFLAQQDAEVSIETYLAQLREARLLQHESLQGKHARYSPTGHEMNVARTFAVSMEQLDLSNPVDSLVPMLLSRAACFVPNEPIPLSLLDFPLFDDARDEFIQEGVARLLSLGLLGRMDAATAVIHPLIALFAHNNLDVDTSASQQALEKDLLARISAHKSQDVDLITLPLSPTHLRFIVDQALLRKDCTAVSLTNLFVAHLLGIWHFEDARHYIERALTLAARICGAGSLVTAVAHINHGNLLFKLGDYKQAEPHYERALAIYSTLFEPDHLEIARMLNYMGTVRVKIGPYESARPFFEQALAIRQKSLGSDHPETMSSLNNLGVLNNYMGNHAEARRYFEQVLAIRERTMGADHLLTAISLNNLGDLLNRMGDWEAGRPLLERALTIRTAQLGEEHPLTLACETNLGELLRGSHEFDRAQSHLQHALTLAESKLGDSHLLTGRILNSLGVLLTDIDRLQEAESTFKRALAIRETTRGDAHPDTSYTRICLGELYEKMGQRATAVALYQRALKDLEQSVKPSHAGLKRVRTNLQRIQQV